MTRSFAVIISGLMILVGCSQSDQKNVSKYKERTSEIEITFDSHWLEQDTFLLRKADSASNFALVYSLTDVLTMNNIEQAERVDLVEQQLNQEMKKDFGHLSSFDVLNGNLTDDQAKRILKGNSLIVQRDASNNIVKLSRLQTGEVLDDLYTSSDNDADEVTHLGAIVTETAVQFKLWAPTAQQVEVLLFDADKKPLKPASLSMAEDPLTGVWTAKGTTALNRAYYQYKLTLWHPTTANFETIVSSDPYALSVSANGRYAQVVNLSDSDTTPEGWSNHRVPEVNAPEDNIFYELHIRDFSATDSALSNAAYRGKYKAFSEQDSHGIKHLKALREAGLNNIHLLPTYDISTVNEDPDLVIDMTDTLEKLCRVQPEHFICEQEIDRNKTVAEQLATYDPRSGDAQALLEVLRPHDPFNWGYDPFHYTVPEGSYATNPEGEGRIIEFREMVQSIHEMGFRVIMDVVYNHTFASGLNEYSVLDRVVPGYYHRLNPLDGTIEQSTCCDNTATERAMMAKLMTDSLVVWARDYKIDGFRFDLMGHQPKQAMLEAREIVRQVDPDTYFYGEGWNFGEVANDAQFVQATQTNLAGTEIGTFTDRLRDAVRGGSFNHNGRLIRGGQGLANGLLVIPNGDADLIDKEAEYHLSMAHARIGLTGNLANYPLQTTTGKVMGSDIDYGGSPTGYALDPADTINYVSKHDNQTLWDSNQYRIAYEVSTEDRVRMQNLALSYAIFAQGIPFIHMGSELLRSKSFLRDSYDYGDWFNAVDFNKQSNNYDVGLPPAVKDEDNWPLITEVLQKNEGRDQVTPEHIQFNSDVFKEYLAIRSSSPLFRLTTGEDIIERIRFHNTGKDHVIGVIAMSIADTGFETDIDPNAESLLVIFNNSGETKQIPLIGAERYKLHPVQARGVDSRLQSGVRITDRMIQVPALTTAVFVK